MAEHIVFLTMDAELTAEQIEVIVEAYEEKYCFGSSRVPLKSFLKALEWNTLGGSS